MYLVRLITVIREARVSNLLGGRCFGDSGLNAMMPMHRTTTSSKIGQIMYVPTVEFDILRFKSKLRLMY